MHDESSFFMLQSQYFSFTIFAANSPLFLCHSAAGNRKQDVTNNCHQNSFCNTFLVIHKRHVSHLLQVVCCLSLVAMWCNFFCYCWKNAMFFCRRSFFIFSSFIGLTRFFFYFISLCVERWNEMKYNEKNMMKNEWNAVGDFYSKGKEEKK